MQQNQSVIVEEINDSDEQNANKTTIKIQMHPLESKLAEFYETKAFIDCYLEISGEQLPCHRLILSKYSNVFCSYFKKHNSTEGKLLAPPYVLNDKALISVIEFCYKSTITVDPSNIVDVFITAAMYGVKSLMALLTEPLLTFLDDTDILDYLPKFKIKLSEETIQAYPDLLDNYRNLRDGIGGISEIVAKNFKFVSRSKFIDNTPLYMLPDILRRIDYTDIYDTAVFSSKDDFVIYTIDKIVGDSEVSLFDKELLSMSVDWSNEDSYLYLTKYKLNWVLPSILRPILGKAFKLRHTSTNAIEQTVGNLKSNTHSAFGIQELFHLVYESKGNTKVESKNVLRSLSTMWGTSQEVNPALVGLIQLNEDSDQPLSQYYDPKNVFVQNKSCYLAHSTCDYKTPSFNEFKNTLKIGFSFDKHIGNKLVPSNLKIDSFSIIQPEHGPASRTSPNYAYDVKNPGAGIAIYCKSPDAKNIFFLNVEYVAITGQFELI